MFLEVRILNELRIDFAEVRIVKGLASRQSTVEGRKQKANGVRSAYFRGVLAGFRQSDDLIWHTRESIAHEYQVGK